MPGEITDYRIQRSTYFKDLSTIPRLAEVRKPCFALRGHLWHHTIPHHASDIPETHVGKFWVWKEVLI